MQRPRLRFTLVGLMAFVAAMAIGFGILVAIRSARQAQFYRAKAEEMTRAEQDHRNQAAAHYNRAMIYEVQIELQREKARDEDDRRRVRNSLESLEFMREMERQEDLLADHYRDLALKYGHAACHPWEPVELDPSPPGRGLVLRRQ